MTASVGRPLNVNALRIRPSFSKPIIFSARWSLPTGAGTTAVSLTREYSSMISMSVSRTFGEETASHPSRLSAWMVAPIPVTISVT